MYKYKFVEIKSYTNKPIKIPLDFGEATIIDSDSKGKIFWLVVNAKNNIYYVHVHYGITGWFTFEKPDSYIKYEFILKNIKTNKEINLFMEDKRRFSKIEIYTFEQHNKIINKLGIDIFSN